MKDLEWFPPCKRGMYSFFLSIKLNIPNEIRVRIKELLLILQFQGQFDKLNINFVYLLVFLTFKAFILLAQNFNFIEFIKSGLTRWRSFSLHVYLLFLYFFLFYEVVFGKAWNFTDDWISFSFSKNHYYNEGIRWYLYLLLTLNWKKFGKNDTSNHKFDFLIFLLTFW